LRTDFVAFDMGCKSALWGQTDALLVWVVEDTCCFINATCDLLWILELGEFTANQAEDNGLMLGEMSQRFKVASPGSVICN
jgi:hypothetical protein